LFIDRRAATTHAAYNSSIRAASLAALTKLSAIEN
jgi:hypothetical protein